MLRRGRTGWVVFLLFLVSPLMARSARAEDQPSSQPADAFPKTVETLIDLMDRERAEAKTVDLQAETLLRRVAERVKKAHTLTVDLQLSTTERHPGSNLTLISEHSLAVSKPDKIAFLTKRAAFESTIVVGACNESRVVIPGLEVNGHWFTAADQTIAAMISNGKKMYMDIPYFGGSGVGDPPSGRDTLRSLFFIYDIAPFNSHGNVANALLRDLLADDVAELGVFGSLGLVDTGPETIDGIECRRLHQRHSILGGYCFLVEGGVEPVLRQVRPLFDPTEMAVHLEMTTTFRNWKFDVALSEEQFAVPPSAGEPPR